MLHGLYATASGMLVASQRHEAAAANLANVNTTGYRRQVTGVAAFGDTLAQLANPTNLRVARPAPLRLHATQTNDPSAGMVRETGNKTDLALAPQIYLTIEQDGGEAYTRNGALTLTPAGRLATQHGQAVLGQQGPITITSPDWSITADGRVLVKGEEIDRLKLAELPDLAAATRLDAGVWNSPTARPAATDDHAVRQGALEGSNVNPVSEMISLLTLTRTFEANQRCLQAQDATLERAVNEIGRA